MTERHVALIDDVAGQMTAAEPGADFRARVLDRISVARQRAPIAGWMAAVRVAAAAAAVLAIAVLLRNTDVGRHEPATRVASGVPAAAPISAATPEAQPVVRPVARVTISAPDPAALRRASELAEWHGRAIPALDDPKAIRDIQPGSLSISQLSVTPLDIAPITIAPIGSEGGR